MKKEFIYLRVLPAMFDVRGSKVITMTSSLAHDMAKSMQKIVDLRVNHSSSQLQLTLALNLISSQGSSMHTKSAIKRTISCTSKSAWKFIFFVVESVI